MIDIAAIFQNKTLVTERLTACGFRIAGGCYEKEYPILNGTYKAVISIAPDGSADFRVYDSDSGEEYMPAHIYHAAGSFVGEIHKACEAILTEIAQQCYISEYFKWEQSKRILAFVREAYCAEPEFLWSSLPECAALRVPGKKPWFAVIGRIPRNKIGAPGNGTAEVINLKAAPEDVKAYRDSGMAFPAYHMNKQHWYTLLLDDTQSDEAVMDLIRKSYALVE